MPPLGEQFAKHVWMVLALRAPHVAPCRLSLALWDVKKCLTDVVLSDDAFAWTLSDDEAPAVPQRSIVVQEFLMAQNAEGARRAAAADATAAVTCVELNAQQKTKAMKWLGPMEACS